MDKGNENCRLGSMLKDLLNKHSLSMRKLSELTKIDTATISRIISGKRKATLEHLKKFSKHLNVSMKQLLDAAGYSVSQGKDKSDTDEYMEYVQNLIDTSYSPDLSIENIDEKLADYGEYVKTEDGKDMVMTDFEEKIKKVDSLGPFINHLKDFYERFRLRKGSYQELTLIGSALLYFIIPVDVIPDYLFPIGYLDDAIAVQMVMKILAKG